MCSLMEIWILLAQDSALVSSPFLSCVLYDFEGSVLVYGESSFTHTISKPKF